MYRLVTKYALLGLRLENEPVSHTPHMMLRPIVGAPHDFETEAAANEWALNNPEEMRPHREFVVLPVRHLVLADLA